MPEEIFDIVDAQDQVIGQATRSEVHAQNLLHRAVNVFLFNSAGEILVQLRSATKDQYPGCFTSSVSGHLDAGETYAKAATREMQEEVGLTAKLEFVEKFTGNADNAYEHTVLYKAVTDETPVCDPDEIADAHFLQPQELINQIADSPDQFTPPFRLLFQWYFEKFL